MINGKIANLLVSVMISSFGIFFSNYSKPKLKMFTKLVEIQHLIPVQRLLNRFNTKLKACITLICNNVIKIIHNLPPFWKEGETQIFKISKKGGTWKNILGWGNQKGGNIFKNEGGAQLFKSNLWIEKNKNGDFLRDKLAKISSKIFLRQQKLQPFWTFIVHIMLKQ